MLRPCRQPKVFTAALRRSAKPNVVRCHADGKRLSRRSVSLSTLLLAGTQLDSSAAANEEVDYDTFAANYDKTQAAASALGLPGLRRTMMSQVEGRVLEAAAGTGINLPFYDFSRVEELTLVDLSQGMLDRARVKVQALSTAAPDPPPIGFVLGDVQNLPFAPESFDTVTDTFSFCVFSEPAKAMSELYRVLSPGGKLLLLEHSRSPSNTIGWYQDITEAPVKAMGKGCSWNQRLEQIVRTTGFDIQDVQYDLLGTVISVRATKPALS